MSNKNNSLEPFEHIERKKREIFTELLNSV